MKSRCLFPLGAALCSLFAAANPAFAQGTAFTYHGVLNHNGAPVNGAYGLRVTLYDAVAAGNIVAGPLTVSPVDVVNGLFTARIDFGAGVFTGPPRWLNIEVKPVGGGSFALLAPRQEVTATPYAVRAANAGGTGGGSAWNLNGADLYYTAGNVGIGTNSPTPGVRLEVIGNVRMHPNGGITGGFLQFGTPNGETGLSIAGANRADIRFDDNTLKLLAGFGPGAMPSENGIAIGTDGNVGIGTLFSTERLTVGGDSKADTKIEINAGGDTYAALRLQNSAGSWLWQATPSNDSPGGRLRLTEEIYGHEWLSINLNGYVGIGTKDPIAKLHVESADASKVAVYGSETGTAAVGVFGNATATSSVGVWGRNPNGFAVYAEGDAGQARDKGGFVKAMLFVEADGTIIRCYNGVTGSSANGCGFSAFREQDSNGGRYEIDFGFQVNDRFVTVTPGRSGSLRHVGASFTYVTGATNPQNKISVVTFDTTNGDEVPANFTIIIY